MKETYIRARISENSKKNFEFICNQLGVVPSNQIRQMIDDFIDQHDQQHDLVTVHIHRPDGYDVGAWRVTAKLTDPAYGLWGGVPIPFRLPNLKYRQINSDEDYIAIVYIDGQPIRGGKFLSGIWHGYVHTDTYPEASNPTTIATVKKEIFDCIVNTLKLFV